MDSNQKITKELRRKKWLSKKKSMIRVNQKKLIKTFAKYKRKSNLSPKNSNNEFEYFTAVSKSFDWRRKTHEEIESMKSEIQWKAFEGIESLYAADKPEMKRSFWKNKKAEDESLTSDETWSFGSKDTPAYLNTKEQDKIFWKTPNISLPLFLNEQIDNRIEKQNMLWRSLKHLQRLYEENYADIRQISEMFNAEIEKMAKANSLEIFSDYLMQKNFENEPSGRKTRLSRWAFLRHDSNYRQRVPGSVGSAVDDDRVKKVAESDLKWFDEDTEYDEVCVSCDCSTCSCEKCEVDLNENSSMDVANQLSEKQMAPNSEEDAHRIQSKRSWAMDFSEKESLRPPVYNPEDYATSLKKWGRKPNSGMQLPLYLSQSTGSIDSISAELSLQPKKQSAPSTKSSSSSRSGDEKQTKKEKESTLKMEKKDLKNKENINRGLKNELLKDFRNPILTLTSQDGEMSLRQFSTVTELLAKLKVDLKLSFPSFVQEFVGDPVDGVTLLLELLRAIQLSQASQPQRCPPQVLRRALLDEHSCLICLKHCLRCSDASRRLASSPAGLFTLAVCIMNNVTQTRIIALELLTKACEPPADGHKAVSEALSTLRLRFGEPVRFRFLVGMLSSAGAVELLAAAMKFINVFMETAPNIQQKVYIQAELEQAGFDSKILRRTLPCNSESVKAELNKWEKNYFDVETLQNKVVEVSALQEKIQILEKRIQILQEEKEILQSLEQCLKERCSELEEEVSIKTTTTTKSSPNKPFRTYAIQQNKRNAEKGESTPAEDEGISSSEQELSQDEDYVKGTYNESNNFEHIKNSSDSRNPPKARNEAHRSQNKPAEREKANNLINYKNEKSNKMKETNVDDGNEIVQYDADSNEEETTIDEVIEELENIVNDAETEAFAREEKLIAQKIKHSSSLFKKPEVEVGDKPKTFSKPSQDKDNFEESEIIPCMLHPQPPRKAKSLVHIYFPGGDFDSHEHIKNEFFDEDTDSESSDSLLTAAREKTAHKNCHRSLEVSDSYNSFSSINTRTLFIKQEEEYEDSELNIRFGFEERNIDEEEIKRKHLKNNNAQYKPGNCSATSYPSQNAFKEKKMVENTKKKVQRENGGVRGSVEKLSDSNFGSFYEKTTSFQGIRSCIADKILNETPFHRSQKPAPTPVKRSQTFHIASSDGEKLFKRPAIRPKPKMGVSGLDFQRTAEQKMKSDQGNYQSVEYKKNSEKRIDANDRYSKKVVQKNRDDGVALFRRGSFDGLLSTTEKIFRSSQAGEINSYESRFHGDKTPAKLKSKSLEKMDEGLDSLIDIVIETKPEETKKVKPKNEWSVEVSKNIGPRTRRSLAESSLFNPQFAKSVTKTEESPKPPKPAQRTSLTRNNSSSTPMHLPIEIKLAPVQPVEQQQYVYNFGLKSAKSEDSLLINSSGKRYPPDGSSSPGNARKNNYEDKTPIYSTPNKQSKLQKFFGNPKFENSTGSELSSSQKYFENNYASITVEKPLSPMPRNVQNVGSTTQKVKNLISASNQSKITSQKSGNGKDGQSPSKPNFLLGTYQSETLINTSPKPIGTSSVLNSINNFNNFLNKKGNQNNRIHSKKGCSDYSSISFEKSGNVGSRQMSMGSSLGSEKVTDSPSGLY